MLDNEEKFVLNPYLKIVLCNEDEILVKHGVRSPFSMIFKDENRKRLLGKIAKHFKTPISIKELLSKKIVKKNDSTEVKSLINQLRKEKILIKPSEDIVNVYLKSILEGESELSQYTVGIIGAGYLGSRVIVQLLKLGVKKLIFLDDRKIENPDNEKYCFDILPEFIEKDKSYVQILQNYISSWGSNGVKGIEGSFDNEEKIREVFKESDFIIVALEFFSPKTLHTINRIALSLKNPWFSVYVDGSEATIGPIYIPGETCCYNEFEIQSEAALRLKDEYFLYKEYLEDEGINTTLIIPPYADIVSGFATTSVIHFLIRRYSFTIGKAIFVDFERLSLDSQEVLKLPRCPACSKTKPPYRHLFI